MPDYPGAIKKIRTENPDIPEDTSVLPAGPIGRFFMGHSNAITNPFTETVYYNQPSTDQMTQDELENTIHHEFQHVRQLEPQSYWQRFKNVASSMVGMDPEGSDYWQRPRELEAYQAENDRTRNLGLQHVRTDPRTGRGDIELPSDTPPVSKRRNILDPNAFYKKYYGGGK